MKTVFAFVQLCLAEERYKTRLKWLADENIPLTSVKPLRGTGLEVAAVGESQAGLVDQNVLALAHKKAIVKVDPIHPKNN